MRQLRIGQGPLAVREKEILTHEMNFTEIVLVPREVIGLEGER